MAPAPPTRREVLLLAVLLLVILFFSNSEPPLPPSPTLPLAPSAPVLEVHTPQPLDTRLTWGSSRPPETTIASHVPGWTILDKLYILKGVVHIVSDSPSTIPDVRYIYSKGLVIKPGQEEDQKRLPTDRHIRVISTKEAKKLFGTSAQTIDGFTFLVNDPPQLFVCLVCKKL
ncbi:hypothetical protein NLJ89_g11598 [Agrocybe chaxingu]|uniref:Uncharacterized protein n=1 Tax=Agrocybe chaxingu TaxID=84603 RepID=A0A9W8JNF3_9AGAR|nr:hypothetical protein NLJ89_g11598 [Agrocybe chaxingu]